MSATTEDARMPGLAGAGFPLDTFREAAYELRRPFEVKAVQWKVQAMWPRPTPNAGLVVPYIDRGLVIDRLNYVVPHLWSARYQDLERNNTICWLTVDGITREDVGEGSSLKERRTDALKRVAVHFGIGVSLARIPKSTLEVARSHVRAKQRGDKWTLELTQGGLNYLRLRYEDWLTRVGEKAYGRPLEHGDIGDPSGDEEAPSSLAEPDEKVELYLLLSEGTTLRQQRGFLSAAGVGNLPSDPKPEDIEQAMSSLSDEQATTLRKLIETKKRGGGAHGLD
jgi:hypothetical protein